jgi:hydrogenase/urease accessory protein HupE
VKPAVVMALLVAVAASAFGVGAARAHDPFEITTDAHVSGDRMDVHTTMSLLTATRSCFKGTAALRQLAPADFEANRGVFEECARDFYLITAGGDALPIRGVTVALTVEADVDMKVAVARPTKTPLVFDAVHLRPMVARAGVVLTVTGERTFLGQELLRPEAPRLVIPIGPDAEAPSSPSFRPSLPSFRGYLRLGVEHILTGYDHLLFLLGVLLVCRRFKTVAAIVTCFTLAHSVTLALAALEVVSMPSRLVETLIAASIVYVGVENIVRGEEPRGRWALTFGFGLIHGLGFASALREIGLGQFGTSLAGPLIGFNLGVELGQLAVSAVLLAVFWRARAWWPSFARHGVRVLSLLVAATGLIWFVQRLTGGGYF